ncbi:DUF6463 family protein [Mycobacterium deserti]|uniref:DUF6463 family protein n=1 Tax=Mycobacterium deserti TaxID=2978347 RepID=A0ABT2MAU9_9MYCO|nr:DUF6463 family protein [Mycobacterium deserti]MCT7659392.1 DUF6463 family protein [Mycobacterium deserti]
MATKSDLAHTRQLGGAVIATGVGHNLIGSYLYRRQIVGMARDGLINSASDARLGTLEGERRHTAFWFLFAGFFLMMLGAGIRQTGGDGERIAPALGHGMTAMGALGAAMMPVSGFWLLLAEGIAATVLRRRGRGQ